MGARAGSDRALPVSKATRYRVSVGTYPPAIGSMRKARGGAAVRFGILEDGEFELEHGRGICDLDLDAAFTGSEVGSGVLGLTRRKPAGARTAVGPVGDALHSDLELFGGGSPAMPRQPRHGGAAKPMIFAARVAEPGSWTASPLPGHQMGVVVFVHVGRAS